MLAVQTYFLLTVSILLYKAVELPNASYLLVAKMRPVKGEKLPQNVEKSIERICKKEGFINYKLETELLDTNGGSYFGKLFLVTVNGATENGRKSINIFVKNIIPTGEIDNIMDLKACYASEAFVYNELSQIFEEIQDAAEIPKEERYNMAKSYGESNAEAIILENVVTKGYKPCALYYAMDLNVAELAMEQIAKFHALSFVIEKKWPKYFPKIKERKTPFMFNEDWTKASSSSHSISMNHVKKDTVERLQAYWPKLEAKSEWYLQPNGTRSCLCHGDFRVNNLLMKETDDRVKNLIITDYQHIYYGCPVTDLMYLIFTGSERKFRSQNLDHLKDYYFQNLTDFLAKFDLDVEDIYPRRDFEKDFKQRLDYGLMSALSFMPFFMPAQGDVPDIGTTPLEGLDFKVHESFPKRLQGVVDDFVEWGYL